MNEYLLNLWKNDLEKRFDLLEGVLARIENRINVEEKPWDNADLTRNWKISTRTLAQWRRDKLIGYSQINGKIFYTAEDRRRFLSSNHVEVIERARS